MTVDVCLLLCCCWTCALCSFSHVIGIDSSAKHIVAAREIQEKGKLVYHPLQGQHQQLQPQLGSGINQGGAQGTENKNQPSDANGSSISISSSSSKEGHSVCQDVTCTAVLSEDADRDRVR